MFSFNHLGPGFAEALPGSASLGGSQDPSSRTFFANLSFALAELHLSNNRLAELPQEIGGLRCLQTLDVSQNELTDLPAGLGYLPRLQRILVEGNPIRRIRRALLDGACSDLKAYLRTRGGPHSSLRRPVSPTSPTTSVGSHTGAVGEFSDKDPTQVGHERDETQRRRKMSTTSTDAGWSFGEGVDEDGNIDQVTEFDERLKQVLREAAASLDLNLFKYGLSSSLQGGSRSTESKFGVGRYDRGADESWGHCDKGNEKIVGSRNFNPLSNPDGVSRMIDVLDSFTAGDTGGHFNDDTWDRRRPAAGAIVKMNLGVTISVRTFLKLDEKMHRSKRTNPAQNRLSTSTANLVDRASNEAREQPGRPQGVPEPSGVVVDSPRRRGGGFGVLVRLGRSNYYSASLTYPSQS